MSPEDVPKPSGTKPSKQQLAGFPQQLDRFPVGCMSIGVRPGFLAGKHLVRIGESPFAVTRRSSAVSQCS